MGASAAGAAAPSSAAGSAASVKMPVGKPISNLLVTHAENQSTIKVYF